MPMSDPAPHESEASRTRSITALIASGSLAVLSVFGFSRSHNTGAALQPDLPIRVDTSTSQHAELPQPNSATHLQVSVQPGVTRGAQAFVDIRDQLMVVTVTNIAAWNNTELTVTDSTTGAALPMGSGPAPAVQLPTQPPRPGPPTRTLSSGPLQTSDQPFNISFATSDRATVNIEVIPGEILSSVTTINIDSSLDSTLTEPTR